MSRSTSTKRPNILLIWTDEQRADTLECYGNQQVHAPHLNELARSSVVFENAYCVQPVCTPSRASILTGVWPHTHQCIENNSPLPTEIPTIAELLGDEYRCAYFGKWHLGDEVIAQRGFDDWLSLEDNYRRYYSDQAYLNVYSDYHGFLTHHGFAPDIQTPDGARVFSRNFAAGLAERYTKASFLGQETAKYLSNYTGEQPFFLSVNFLEPHMPFFGPLNDVHAPEALEAGPAFARPPATNASLRNRALAGYYQAFGMSGYPLKTQEHWRRMRANYYGLVSLVDNAIGTILTTLRESGLEEETVIIFTSDHGEMMGDHGLIGKCVLYEESIRIPLLMRLPRIQRENKVLPGRVSQIDLVPTILDLAGVERPDHLRGRSLLPVVMGQETLGDNDVVVEWNGSNGIDTRRVPPGFSPDDLQRVSAQTWRTLVTHDGWKLNISNNDRLELYNLQDDPFELVNLANSRGMQLHIQRLVDRLHTWQSRENDSVNFPSYDRGD